MIRISKPSVRDASEAGVDLAADRALDVGSGIAVHLVHGHGRHDGERDEDGACHPRHLKILFHAAQHTRN